MILLLDQYCLFFQLLSLLSFFFIQMFLSSLKILLIFLSQFLCFSKLKCFFFRNSIQVQLNSQLILHLLFAFHDSELWIHSICIAILEIILKHVFKSPVVSLQLASRSAISTLVRLHMFSMLHNIPYSSFLNFYISCVIS